MQIFKNGAFCEATEGDMSLLADIVDVALETRAQIEELKQCLADTDYAIIKIAEGAATKEEYSELIARRQGWREEVNKLQKELEEV